MASIFTGTYMCMHTQNTLIHIMHIYTKQKTRKKVFLVTTSIGKQFFFFKIVEVNGVKEMAKQVRVLA